MSVGKTLDGLVKNSFESFKSPFTKNFYTNPMKTLQTALDPGHLVIKGLGNKPVDKPPVDPNAVAADAAAREKERRRLASGSAQSNYTPRKTDALSASIGKRFLGGGS